MNDATMVRGDGVAAACCARILSSRNLPVSATAATAFRPSAVLLSEATQSLLTSLFADRHLFDGVARITRRVVAWGPGAEPRSLPHSAIAISEQELVSRLWARLSGSLRDPEEAHGEHGVWEIVSSRRELAAVEDKHFGSRTAMAARVRLAAHAGSTTCWTESLEEGWLFLFATAHETGCLIAVGDDAPSLLAQSRLIAAQIAVPVEFGQAMPAYPRILSQLCGPGWLACGSAAMAFDPICGEGTAHAVREAILASAVIHAAQRYDPVGLLEHYKARLMGGFLRHLQLSHHYYCTGGTGAFWRSELQLLKDGANWLGDQLRSIPGARFRLENFDLVPLEGQAVPQAR